MVTCIPIKKRLLNFNTVMLGSSSEMKQYTKHKKLLVLPILLQATEDEKIMIFLPRHPTSKLSLKLEVFWESPKC